MSDITTLMMAAAGGAAEETDANFNQTVLLLHGDGTNGAQNNTFLDSSTNNFTITRNGNTTQGTFSPFSAPDGRWSNYFDGSVSAARINTPSSSSLSPGASDFSVEVWINCPIQASNGLPVFIQVSSTGGAANTNWGLFALDTGEFRFSASDGSAYQASMDTGISVCDNEWHHLAVSRDGSDWAFFVDGSRVATDTWAGTVSTTSRSIWLGSNQSSTVYYKGYLANASLVIGSAVYDPTVTTITVPTSPISPSRANQKLLACYSNRFIDSNTATTANTLTITGTPKVTPFSPFAPTAAYDASVNGGSGYFDGSDYLTVGTSTDWKFIHDGTTAFTIQAWIYMAAIDAASAIIGNTASSGEIGFALSCGATANTLRLRIAKGTSGTFGLDFESSANLRSNAWNHIAVTHDGSSNYTFYINGSSVGTDTAIGYSASNPTNDTTVAVNDSAGGLTQYLSGYIASLKISDVAESISLPTAPFTSDANTKLLLNFTNAGIFDNTGKNNLETVGNAQIDTTTKKYGTGSMEFDGTGDELVAPNSEFYSILSGDYTIEFWVYLNDSTSRGLMACVTSGAKNGWSLEISATPTIKWLLGDGSTINVTAESPTISTSTWTHIACVKNGSTINVYADGIAGTSSTVSNVTAGAGSLFIGDGFGISSGNFAAKANSFNGLIDDLRITKGVARYTTTFTPPTKAFPDL